MQRIYSDVELEAFYHPFLVAAVQQVDGEDRTFVIGRTDAWRILGLVYTIRQDKVHVVTAFRPSEMNRERYMKRFKR